MTEGETVKLRAPRASAKLSYLKASKILSYDPKSGKLVWKARPVFIFNDGCAAREWNNRFAGKEAFTCVDENGYRRGGILGKNYLGHRIAWLLHYKSWPKRVKHLNGDLADNRIRNLKDKGASA